MNDQILLTPLIMFVGSIGGSGLLGICCGAFFRKAGVWIAICLGALTFLLGFLAYNKFIIIDFNKFADKAYSLSMYGLNESQKILSFISEQFEGGALTIGSGATFGFIGGFLYGVTRVK